MPIGAQHIAPAGGGFEPQRSYDFEVELHGVPGGPDPLRLALSEAFLPELQMDIIEISYMAEKRKVAGQANYRDGQLTFVDYVDQKIFNLLLGWSKLVYDPGSGSEGYASDYKKQASILLKDPRGAVNRVFTLDGVWPSTVTAGPLSYNGSDTVKAQVTLTYDRMLPV